MMTADLENVKETLIALELCSKSSVNVLKCLQGQIHEWTKENQGVTCKRLNEHHLIVDLHGRRVLFATKISMDNRTPLPAIESCLLNYDGQTHSPLGDFSFPGNKPDNFYSNNTAFNQQLSAYILRTLSQAMSSDDNSPVIYRPKHQQLNYFDFDKY